MVTAFEIICEHPSYSAEEIADKLGKTLRTVGNYIAKLKHCGVIVRRCPKLGGYREVIENE